MKTCIIKQPAGLGDIFCCQKIANKLIEKYNCNIIWPVISQYDYIQNYISNDRIWFVNQDKDFIYKELYNSGQINITQQGDVTFIPLETSTRLYDRSLKIIEAKYRLANLTFNDWHEHFIFNRNKVKEDMLYYNVLGLKDGDDYCLVNDMFASPPHTQRREGVKPSGKYSNIINLEYIEQFNPFDWCKVIEQAKEIHMVDTCYTYFLEVLQLTSSDINIYSRNPPGQSPSYTETQLLFNRSFNWIYD